MIRFLNSWSLNYHPVIDQEEKALNDYILKLIEIGEISSNVDLLSKLLELKSVYQKSGNELLFKYCNNVFKIIKEIKPNFK